MLAAVIVSVVTIGVVNLASAAAGPRIQVGDGTASSCTEATLRSALATAEARGGGIVSFKCGSAPVVIVIAGDSMGAGLTVPDKTVIDGGGLVTFTGLTAMRRSR
jgi:hypothetical protein